MQMLYVIFYNSKDNVYILMCKYSFDLSGVDARTFSANYVKTMVANAWLF